MKKREQNHQPQYNRISNSLPTTISTISFYRLYIYRTGITNINKRIQYLTLKPNRKPQKVERRKKMTMNLMFLGKQTKIR